MNFAHDIYAETNPAYCAVALARFTQGYCAVNANGPELAVAYLALPIGLSEELAGTFNGTNKRTGLNEWIARNPCIRIAFAERVNSALDIVSSAIKFAVFSQILTLGPDGRLLMGPKFRLSARAARNGSKDINQTLRRTETLGCWFSGVGSARSIFDALGVTI